MAYLPAVVLRTEEEVFYFPLLQSNTAAYPCSLVLFDSSQQFTFTLFAFIPLALHLLAENLCSILKAKILEQFY